MSSAALVKPSDPAPESNIVLLFERLASNKDVDVAKLERLIAMQERILAHNAKAAFDAAFAVMAAEIPTIVEKGQTNNGRYARLEDIVDVVRPILTKHGFAVSFRTEWPDKQTVKVVGILTHRDGHARESEFLTSADDSGNKNRIQSLGSAVSYGRRYTLRDLLNITSRGEDDDGQRTSKPGKPEAPAGYDQWLIDLSSVADEGDARLRAVWNSSKPIYRAYLTKHEAAVWAGIKAKALKVGAP